MSNELIEKEEIVDALEEKTKDTVFSYLDELVNKEAIVHEKWLEYGKFNSDTAYERVKLLRRIKKDMKSGMNSNRLNDGMTNDLRKHYEFIYKMLEIGVKMELKLVEFGD